jgi:cytochrome c biogenesis protein CcdA
MGAWLAGSASALWLGVLTSVCPCALGPSVAAIGFLGRAVGRPRSVLAGGLLYTLGRTAAYVVLGAATVSGLLAAPAVSQFLQVYMNKILGPILVLVGAALLELIAPDVGGLVSAETLVSVARRGGLAAAALLGALLAVSFCPVTAALFFGNVAALCLKYESRVLLPALYGVGTALPIVVFAVVTAWGAGNLARLFEAFQKVERWARRATGALFVLLGTWYTLVHIFGLGDLFRF